MPRRPKPPPAGYDVKVEGLSEPKAEQVEAEFFPCEFTGELIRKRIVADLRKPKAKAKVITNYTERERAERKQREAELVRRYVEQRDKAHAIILAQRNALKPKLPEPAHNQVHTQSGLVITVPRPTNAFKRRF